MLKKSLLISSVLLFAFGILLTSVLRASIESRQCLPTGQVLAAESVDYFLPYPGILPGHFLYPIKVLRDKILLFLTTGKVKRAERLLHFADKRMEAARLLAQEGKGKLAVEAAIDSQKFLKQVVGEDSPLDQQLLGKAIAKHIEVLTEIEQSLTGDQADQIRQLRQQIEPLI